VKKVLLPWRLLNRLIDIPQHLKFSLKTGIKGEAKAGKDRLTFDLPAYINKFFWLPVDSKLF